MEVTHMIDAREGARLPEGAVQQAYLPQDNMEEMQEQLTLDNYDSVLRPDPLLRFSYSMKSEDIETFIENEPMVQSCANEDVNNAARRREEELFPSTRLKEGTKKWQNNSYSMDPELYRSATTGNTKAEALQEESADTESPPFEQLSPRQNTVLHLAARSGHHQLVDLIVKRFPNLHCPDSIELLDEQGQNILHAATKFGKAKLVSYMLKTRDLEMLINERDLEGNTPLHLATLNWHPKVVSILTLDKRVNLKLVNNNGQTAIDVAEKNIGTKPPFRMRLTLMALKSAKAPRAERDRFFRENSESSPSLELPKEVQYNERVNTLLLVATLVATMTFAAGFTMPGGFNSSGSQGEGMVTLVMKSRFHVFLICNTIAMYSSVTAVVILIWAQLGDLNLILAAFKLALPLLAVALTMMSLAFMTGVYLVVGNLSWLANVVLIMGSIFVIIIPAFFLSLIFPFSSSNVILRYIFYYPFCLMIWVTRSNIDGRKE